MRVLWIRLGGCLPDRSEKERVHRISGTCRKSGTAAGVLSIAERVWRHLIVAAGEGHREWSTSTVHDALSRPVEIGAVGAWPSGGVVLLDPDVVQMPDFRPGSPTDGAIKLRPMRSRRGHSEIGIG